jgi:hypothetical protein
MKELIMAIPFVPFAEREKLVSAMEIHMKTTEGRAKLMAFLDTLEVLEPLKSTINDIKNEILIANILNETIGQTEI